MIGVRTKRPFFLLDDVMAGSLLRLSSACHRRHFEGAAPRDHWKVMTAGRRSPGPFPWMRLGFQFLDVSGIARPQQNRQRPGAF
jgi:hypothetical protein